MRKSVASSPRPTPTKATRQSTAKPAQTKKTATPPKTQTTTKAASKSAAHKSLASATTPGNKIKTTKTPPPSPSDTNVLAKTAHIPEDVSNEIQKLIDSTPNESLTGVSTSEDTEHVTSTADAPLLNMPSATEAYPDVSASQPITDSLSKPFEPMDMMMMNGQASPISASDNIIDPSATLPNIMSPLLTEEMVVSPDEAKPSLVDLISEPVHVAHVDAAPSVMSQDPVGVPQPPSGSDLIYGYVISII